MLGVLLAALQSGPSMLAVFTTVHIWGAILTTIAFVVGLVVGPSQMARLLGHLWGTELGAHRALSLSLWLGVFVVVAVTYVVSQ